MRGSLGGSGSLRGSAMGGAPKQEAVKKPSTQMMIGGKLVGVRNRRYGRTMIAIYASNPSGKWNLDVRSEEFLDVPRK